MPHRNILKFFNIKALDQEQSQIVLIRPDGTILWFNRAWTQAARENGSDDIILSRFPIGASYYDGIVGDLRGYYKVQFSQAIETGEPFFQEYECSTTVLYRLFELRALPIESEALLLEHTQITSNNIRRAAAPANEVDYRFPNGLIYQCSNCRRTKNLNNVWVWVPEWVSQSPPHTSHGICKVCVGYYWGQKLQVALPRKP
jgi:hypothetical protein